MRHGNYNNLRNMIMAQAQAPGMDRGTGFTQANQRGKVYNSRQIDEDTINSREGVSQDLFIPQSRSQPMNNPFDNTTQSGNSVWKHSDGTPASPAEIREFFGGDLKQNPNIPIEEQGIDFDRIRSDPNRRQNLMDELDRFTKGRRQGDLPKSKFEAEMEGMIEGMNDESLRYPTQNERDNIRRSGNPFPNWKMHGDGNPFATPTDEEMNRYKNNQDQFLNKMQHPLNRLKNFILQNQQGR